MSVLKLNALGYKAILFLGHHDRNGQINGDMIHFLEPAEGAAQDIIMKMSKLYEHLLSKCRKHRAQKIFLYQGIVDRRVINGKEEVKVMWTPCSICAKVWNDTWEPAQQYS
ncbi:uncharacterized protein LOC143740155 isoform X2 [Siphateles boraxobius]|uniref:uncharacterized protein LOC143740155 isoform X2 n=1 Tax=Siphateles boraxobius TaxID=180520 RepID=UPI0040639DE3